MRSSHVIGRIGKQHANHFPIVKTFDLRGGCFYRSKTCQPVSNDGLCMPTIPDIVICQREHKSTKTNNTLVVQCTATAGEAGGGTNQRTGSWNEMSNGIKHV